MAIRLLPSIHSTGPFSAHVHFKQPRASNTIEDIQDLGTSGFETEAFISTKLSER